MTETGSLVPIVYELLDAHEDTVNLAGIPLDDVRWSAHLEYLRALQRRSREILAACDAHLGR